MTVCTRDARAIRGEVSRVDGGVIVLGQKRVRLDIVDAIVDDECPLRRVSLSQGASSPSHGWVVPVAILGAGVIAALFVGMAFAAKGLAEWGRLGGLR